MNMFQALFTRFADVLLSSRSNLPFLNQIQNQTKDLGLVWGRDCNIQSLLQNNWRATQHNEMIVQFFLESEGNSYLVEEWSLQMDQLNYNIQSKQTPKRLSSLTKQLTIWLRSAITLMSMTTLFQEEQLIKQCRISHSLLFYNKNTKKRSDWIDDSKLQVKKITTRFLNELNFYLTVAQQGSLTEALNEKRVDSPLFSRCRFNSEQIVEKDSYFFRRKLTTDSIERPYQKTHSSSSNNLNRSFVSVYSKKEEVELLLTPEEAVLKLQDRVFAEEDYEIHMDNNEQKEIFMSQISLNNRMTQEQRLQQQNLLELVRNIQQRSKQRRQRSIQIIKLMSFFEQ